MFVHIEFIIGSYTTETGSMPPPQDGVKNHSQAVFAVILVLLHYKKNKQLGNVRGV